MEIKYKKSSKEEMSTLLSSYLKTLSSPIDSFLEDHIVDSEFFSIISGRRVIGYFAVHEGNLLTQFYLKDNYRMLGQRVFADVKKMLTVKEAFVPTCDEFFLSHAVDGFSRLEKQAYFFCDSGKKIRKDPEVSLRTAVYTDIGEILEKTGDFFGELERKVAAAMIYIAERDGMVVGYGIMEPGILVKDCASIGMFTVPEFRQQGVGRNIILGLKDITYGKGMKPIAGCWYYNHNSKKTLESAGMKTQTRLLRFVF